MAQSSEDLIERLSQKVYSMEFRDTNIRDLIRLLARQNSLNIVISPEVDSRVSVSLTNVTVEDVLKSVLNSQGYHYLIENDVIMIKSFERQVYGEAKSKLFHLNYLDGVDMMETLLPFLTSKGMIKVLDLVKTDKIEDRRSDVLLVKDIPDNLTVIEGVIKELDIPQLQLQIEVRLVETIIDESEKYGFNWPKSATMTLTGADPTGESDFAPGDANNPGYAAYSALPVRQNSVKLGILTADELMVTLDLLARDENSKLISNPKVTTLNNRKAMIRIGTNIPIPQVSRGVGGDLITYEDKAVDVKLEVTPRVEPGNKINLAVHPMIEEIVGYTGPGDYPQPITSIREIQTIVSVLSNETVVLGGMVKDNETTIENKVWLLGDIPLLGELFKSTTSQTQKKDLLIFITPKLILEGK
jgi:type IV pilus assembly protein PilQ